MVKLIIFKYNLQLVTNSVGEASGEVNHFQIQSTTQTARMHTRRMVKLIIFKYNLQHRAQPFCSDKGEVNHFQIQSTTKRDHASTW